MRLYIVVWVATLWALCGATYSQAEDTRFKAPGDLQAGSGTGVSTTTIFLPGIRFPLEDAPAFLNSQVYRAGGMHGGSGGQCADANYDFPWRDNFCEKRSRTNTFCPTGTGHQGQDIRAKSCVANRHWAVAVEDGVISNIGSYSVSLLGESGTLYRYLHLQMDDLQVGPLTQVRRGQRIGKVSNHFGGTPTTIHLHFEARRTVLLGGKRVNTFVPPYTSLVKSFRELSGSTR